MQYQLSDAPPQIRCQLIIQQLKCILWFLLSTILLILLRHSDGEELRIPRREDLDVEVYDSCLRRGEVEASCYTERECVCEWSVPNYDVSIAI